MASTKYLFADAEDLIAKNKQTKNPQQTNKQTQNPDKWETEGIAGAMSYVGKNWWSLVKMELTLDGSVVGKIEHIEQKQVGKWLLTQSLWKFLPIGFYFLHETRK